MSVNAFDEMMSFHKANSCIHEGTWASEKFHQRAVEALQQLQNDAELGRKLRALVSGGPFDLTDSPKSLIAACKQMIADQATAGSLDDNKSGV